MALDILCSSSGINGGTTECPIAQGVGKYLIVWGGKLTPTQLLSYTTTKAALIADSKKSKNNSNKLVVFPILRDFKINKETNTEVKLADGYSQVVREGLPGYTLDIVSDVYLTHQLRKLNNKRIKYLVVDGNNLCGGTIDANGNFVGRRGKLFTDGLDFHGFDKVDGQTMVTVTAEDAAESYDNDKYVQLDKTPMLLFSALKDIYLYEKATATTGVGAAATATYTVTNVGTNGDTIDILVSGNSITSGPYNKVAADSSVTLLAAKLVIAINFDTLTTGFSATSVAGVITITAPVGTSFNAVTPVAVIVGTIAGTATAFSGGSVGGTTLKVSGKMESPIANKVIDFYADYSSSALGTNASLWRKTDTVTGLTTAVSGLATNVAGYFDVNMGTLVSGRTYTLNTDTPDVLDAQNVIGIEGNELVYTAP